MSERDKTESVARRTAGSAVARGLAPCPSTPNCVSSLAERGSQKVEPLRLDRPPAEAWDELAEIVGAMKRTVVVERADGYLHAECRSLVFRFVDDLELVDRGDGKTVDVRSASRVGHSDLGVNRRRVERLRRKLIERGLHR